MRCNALLAAVLCAALLVLPVCAMTGEELTDVLTDGDAQTWVTETLPTMAGNGGEWYAIALSQAETTYDFSQYAAALTAYFRTERVGSAVERQRIALALLAIGADSTIPDEVASESVGKQGVMSLVFGLHLLQNGANSQTHTVQSITEALLARQNADGGWCVSGTRSDADVTAMALQALAPQQEAYPDEIGRALECLSAMQKEDASFASYGVSNAESCCQVIVALTALGIDPETDARFVKNGKTVTDALLTFRLSDGSFAHIAGGKTNTYACQQALIACIALERFAQGKGGFYLFDREETFVPEPVESEDCVPSHTESSLPSESESSPTPHAPAGMSPLRIGVLCIALVTGLASLLYMLFGKK